MRWNQKITFPVFTAILILLVSCIPEMSNAELNALSDEEFITLVEEQDKNLAGQAGKFKFRKGGFERRKPRLLCEDDGEQLTFSRGSWSRSIPKFFRSAREGDDILRERICRTSGYTSTITRCEFGCEEGRCVPERTVQDWDDPGSEEQITLSISEVHELSDGAYLRLESIDRSGASFSFWVSDERGCKLIEDYIYLKDIDTRERYSNLGEWLFEFEEFVSDSVTFNMYTGAQASGECMAHYEPVNFCHVFPSEGKFKIGSEHFSRHFFEENQANYSDLMLNYQERSYDKLLRLYPNLVTPITFGERWKFIIYESEAYSSDNAFFNSALFKLFEDSRVNQIINNNDLVDEYNEQLEEDNLNFEFSTDVHEWTHILLWSTDLGTFCNSESCRLVEGIADYIQNKVKYNAEDFEEQYNECRESGFVKPGSVIDGMTYEEAFDAGYSYATGNCFFKKVEEACGDRVLNSVFRTLHEHSYEPLIEYPSLFSLIRNSCDEPSQFDLVMENFGFSLGLLEEEYPLTPEDLIRDSACFG